MRTTMQSATEVGQWQEVLLRQSGSLRSKGIGGMALNELVSNYVNYMIVVEYETPNSASSANEINIRRKGFYKRNGLQYLHTTQIIFL